MNHLTISDLWINGVLRGFLNLGLDIAVITRGLPGFEGAKFKSGQRLELGAAREMWHRAQLLSQDPLLGYTLGSSLDYRAIGVLAPVIWHSGTAFNAMDNILRYQSLISDSGRFICEKSSDQIEYIYLPTENAVPANSHQIQSVIVATVCMLREITNGHRLPYMIGFDSKVAADTIGRRLNTQVVSRHSHTCICYSVEGFDQPLPGRDLYLYEMNKAYAEKLLASKTQGQALIGEVKQFIIDQGVAKANVGRLSIALSIPVRALQRALLAQGTSFRCLKEEVCKEISVTGLRDGKNIDSLVETLGYSEASAFHRAFKSWFGMTPKEFLGYRIM